MTINQIREQREALPLSNRKIGVTDFLLQIAESSESTIRFSDVERVLLFYKVLSNKIIK